MCKYHMNTVILSVLSVQGGLHYLHIEKPNLGEKLEEVMKKQDYVCVQWSATSLTHSPTHTLTYTHSLTHLLAHSLWEGDGHSKQ